MADRYFNFLCNITGKKQTYSMLLEELHNTAFYSLIPNDENRCEDGTQLRENFLNEEGRQALSFCDIGECTMLEMLLALSFRLEFESMSGEWEKTPREWFWILVNNLGLSHCTNQTIEEVDERNVLDDIDGILRRFLERGYERNGNGGLFPLKNAKKDQRRVEIWYQMSAYMLENYPV